MEYEVFQLKVESKFVDEANKKALPFPSKSLSW